jgi:hypothetical protein
MGGRAAVLTSLAAVVAGGMVVTSGLRGPLLALASNSTDTTCTPTSYAADVAAAGNSGTSTITFNCALNKDIVVQSTTTVSSGQTLTVTSIGPGTVTLDGNSNQRIFYVDSLGNLTLDNLILAHGSSGDSNLAAGGALANFGTTQISHTWLKNNSAASFGGAVYNEAFLTVDGSTFSDNSAQTGGGAIETEGTNNTATITNSTFSGNSAGGDGGGALFNDLSTTSLTNVTMSGNSATNETNGGGLYNLGSGPLTVANSIIAGNTPDNCYAVTDGENPRTPATDGGYNLESSDDCNFTATGSQQGANPLLGPLQNNGGPTPTMALPSSSPAVDVIPTGSCATAIRQLSTNIQTGCGACHLTTDQRGDPRPDNSESACDIGAYELQDSTGGGGPAIATATALSSSVNPASTGQSVTYTATVSPSPDGGTVGFTDNGVAPGACGAVTVSNGTATCTVSYSAVGDHTIVASYSGDPNYGPSGSGPLTEHVVAATTTTVTSSANPSTTGQSVTYTATMSPTPDGGTVGFTDNGAAMTGCGTLALSGATATCSTTYGATGSHTIVATYSGDTNFGSSSGMLTQSVVAPSTTTNPVGRYLAQQPTRVCDTRPIQPGVSANQCNSSPRPAGQVGPQGSVTVDVCNGAGANCNLLAVVVNVTAVNQTAASFVTVYPTGVARPVASNLNTSPADTVANLVEVKVGNNGTITLYNDSGSTDLVVDLEGTVVNASSGPGLFTPVTPSRICDTRPNQPGVTTNECNNGGTGATLAAGTMTVQVTGQGGIPASGVSAVVLNLTATDTTANSYLAAWGTGAQPVASNENWTTGETVSNRVIVPVSATGQVSVANLAGKADVAMDINGWYGDGTESTPGAGTVAITPTRICDTRADGPGVTTNQCNNGGVGAAVGPNQTLIIQVTGGGVVPTGAKGVVLNVTATNTGASSFATVWPSDASQPVASDVNWVAGDMVPNLVVVKLSPSGQVSVYNLRGSTDIVVDVMGYFS